MSCGGTARLRGRLRRPPAFRRQPAPLRGRARSRARSCPRCRRAAGGQACPHRCGDVAGGPPWGRRPLVRPRQGGAPVRPPPCGGGGRHRRTVWRGVQAGNRGQARYTAVGGTGGGCGCGRAGAASTSGVCRGAASGAGAWAFFSSIVTPPLRSRLPGSSAPPPGTFPAPPRKRAGR